MAFNLIWCWISHASEEGLASLAHLANKVSPPETGWYALWWIGPGHSPELGSDILGMLKVSVALLADGIDMYNQDDDMEGMEAFYGLTTKHRSMHNQTIVPVLS